MNNVTRQSNSSPGPFLVEWEVIDTNESRVRQEATVATLAEAAERIRVLEVEGYGESASVWDANGRLVPHMDYSL